MYSVIKNVQILVALLKKHNVSKVVISPGGNNIPIIHSIESDLFFSCYSVVDERSAAYFAMGLAQECGEIVALVCTSGTAVCNYLPGLTEAKYQRVPLIVITSDRNQYLLHQLETQKIEQIGIFGEICKKEVSLPVVNTKDDEWYCSRLINEALVEVCHHGCAPVHINVPTTGNALDYTCKQLPQVTALRIFGYEKMNKEIANEFGDIINNSKKILLVFGENFKKMSKSEAALINDFCEKTKAVCLADCMSNIGDIPKIYSYKITETMTASDFEALVPELVITFGNNILSNSLKKYMRQNREKIQHWCVDEAGEIRDVFKSLKIIFECSNESFFSWINRSILYKEDKSYLNLWKSEETKTVFEDTVFSSLMAVSELTKRLPDGSSVHLAILNSTRLFNLFANTTELHVYSNIGALGIDGCMSTFIGHSFVANHLCFLIIGDLSFFYDMNSLGIRDIGSNVRILLLNNGGGSEFHYNMGKKNVPTLNQFISVEHQKRAKGWVESLGFDYYSIQDQSELHKLDYLVNKSEKPVLVEVFTDMEKDAEIIKSCYSNIRYSRSASSKLKGALINFLNK